MDILDYFDELARHNARTAVVGYFYFDFEAQVAAARLRDAGIPCYVSNAISATQLPSASPSIGVHVLEADLARAKAVLADEEALLAGDSKSVGQTEDAKSENPGLWWLGILALAIILAFLLSQVRLG